MADRWFVDTNVPVYAADTSHPDKQPRAAAWMAYLWRTRSGRVSFQVLQEYYVTVTRKLVPGMPREAARSDVRSLLAWNPLPVEATVVEEAWMIEERYKLSWWDALIVASAQSTGCSWLLTEDLQEGQSFDGVRVVNPFSQEPPRP